MQQNTNNNKQYSQFHSLLDIYIMPEGQVSAWSKDQGWWVTPGSKTKSDPIILGPRTMGDTYLSYVIYIPQNTEGVWCFSTCNNINEIE